ncbi:MAG: HPr family phosphocarrier protein [Gammaproteobacteria bacterium]|nr:HPr family phosphocarrier protein [Gammaproteobacteria bacterium]
MTTGKVTIVNKLGLHARAAAKFIQLSKSFPCVIQLGRSEDALVNGKSIMNIMTLTAEQGTELVLKTDGDEAEQAFEALSDLINNRFGEVE